MIRPYSELEGLTTKIIGCAIEVHRELGPGLLESVYRECLAAELTGSGLSFESGQKVPIIYKGDKIRTPLELDLVVEGQVVLELKAVDALHAVHEAQLITYLKLTGCPAGLLINFNEVLLKNGLRRLDRPDLYRANRLLRGKPD